MKTIRNIGIVIIASLLLATTGGFSIYHHICACFGDSSSVFFKASCKHEHIAEQASCCVPASKPSCCNEKPAPVHKTVYHNHDCCKNSSRFLRISDSFQPSTAKVILKLSTPESVLLNFVPRVDENTSVFPVKPVNAGLPPPDSGREMLLAHHQLKIAPSQV